MVGPIPVQDGVGKEVIVRYNMVTTNKITINLTKIFVQILF